MILTVKINATVNCTRFFTAANEISITQLDSQFYRAYKRKLLYESTCVRKFDSPDCLNLAISNGSELPPRNP